MPTLDEMLASNPHLQEAVRAAAAQAQQTLDPAPAGTAIDDDDAIWKAEIAARRKYSRELNLEAEKITQTFYATLMAGIQQSFGYVNPEWEKLGYKEKNLWIEAGKSVIGDYTAKKTGALPGENRRRIE